MTPDRRAANARTVAVWGFTLCLAAASAALGVAWFGSLGRLNTALHLPWPLFAAAFAVGNFAAVRVEFHDESHSLNLSDAFLLPAIAFASPQGVVYAAVVGYLVRAVWVRQSVIKAAFNVALHAFVATVGVLCFHAIVGSASVIAGSGWLAGIAVIALACVISDSAVQLVIGLTAGRVAIDDLRRVATTFLASLVAKTILGFAAFVGIHMIDRGMLPAVLFLLSALIIGIGYASYGRLQARHAILAQLYRFDQALAGLAESDEVVAAVLGETLSLLGAGVAQLVVLWPEGPEFHTLRSGKGQQMTVENGPHPLASLNGGAMGPVLATPSITKGPVHDALVATGLRDAIIVPVPTEGTPPHLLVVANRLGGDHITFKDTDVTLLGALAAHTAMALRSCRLLDELRSQVEVKEYQAHHDGLTGMANRALFALTLDEAVREREKGRVVGVLLMDLDGFKAINDTMGHDSGDLLLQQLGARLMAVVGDHGLIARLGGDEFAVILPDRADLEEVRRLAEYLCVAVKEPVSIGESEVAMRASVGLAIAPKHGIDRSTLMRRADVAMYQAKRRGGGVAVYDDRWIGTQIGNPLMVSALRGAIDASTLELHYQPKAELRTGRVSGVEALLRWTHPTHGLVGTDQAIAIAERSGLIRPLTLWVLDAALSEVAAWRLAGIDVGLAVNLSPTLLADPAIADDVGGLLETHSFAPDALTLELTESVWAGRQENGDVAERLAYKGVRLSIDDFGIGASSLARLKDLPVHELKIDRSFVGQIAQSKRAATIVASTVRLGHELGLTAVAEGVETEVAWHALRHLRCDVAQGYFVSRPMPGDEFPAWFEHQGVLTVPESNIIPLSVRTERG